MQIALIAIIILLIIIIVLLQFPPVRDTLNLATFGTRDLLAQIFGVY